ncbi:PREDICTED: uncharacterized protein LOC104613045 isoform X2 [Nelumbo nucifera]|uniref:Uncharacterized protein LOC104613045 isoform X2 n=1 Tax=Nelumbo nucifera TaxID=4432 RepID=A0A1U8QCI4_NELNU|nr:PREDICTED: uncharacterized protein LOC104613045 isoform X2 [Nelumbo nucifera]XP_019055972.1 PREDICTED: uncharacterized protein LOC104613045 isoform X2 [Nelumbo nucifera]
MGLLCMTQATIVPSSWRVQRQDSLLSILRMVLVPAPSVLIEEDMYLSLLSGVSYGKAMLHHAGAHPCQPIAPVTYMWRPWSGKKISVENKEPTGNGLDQSQITISESPFRQLWVWIHAAALDEGYDALKLACQKEIHGSGNFVNCVTREGELARLEVLGLKGIQILQKILSPTSGVPENSFQLDKFSTLEATDNSLLQKSFILEHDEYLPSRAILSLTVLDPRNLPEKRTEHVQVPSAGLQCDLVEDESKQTAAPMTSRLYDDKFLYPGWLKIKEKSVFFSDSNGLWDTCKGINPPLEESILCMEKHQQHLAFLYLDKSQSEILTNKVKEQSSRSCPILLLKDNDQRGSFAGWSIILPLSWVKAFWVPLVSHGAHAIGLREKHWISCAVGFPSFPFDFPDCNAYSCFMATEAASFDKKVELRPFPVRPLKVPIPPPWNCIRFTLEERSTTVGDTIKGRACKGELYLYSSLENSGYKNCRSTLLESGISPFQGFVARTSNILTNYLSEIHGDDLLLFPGAPKNKRTFSRLMKNEVNHLPNPKVAIEIPLAQKLCFLRVLLYAYKEGVFEEGAVVCAPNPSDLSMWTDRSDRDGGLQIPQSLIGSYFKQQASSNWELEIPEDPVARESHRWPIGFVTTGFVRGSKKPVAQAFCEATLLARLREEQWNEIPKKRKRLEIYVLVRNLRSSAYRLALATIILEQQDEDVDLI